MKEKIKLTPIVFIGCCVIATIIELITSYLCEFFIGSWPWQTYVDYAINFEGRIALSPSIRFGLGGVFLLYFIQPFLERTFENKDLKVLSFFLFLVILVDCIYTFIF